MKGTPTIFNAHDAFEYTDAYRRAIKWPADQLELERARLEKNVEDTANATSINYAKLRACEHALTFVSERQSPSIVHIGSEADFDIEDENDELDEFERKQKMLEKQVMSLQTEVLNGQKRESHLESKVSQFKQETMALRSRISYYNTAQLVMLVMLVGFFFLSVMLVVNK